VAPAVEEGDVLVTVVAEHPVRVCGEPVRSITVENDRRIGRDSQPAHEGLEGTFVDDVSAEFAGEVSLPIETNRPGEVCFVVDVGVDVYFDEAKRPVVCPELVEVLVNPVCIDEDIGLSCRSH
jgi:hypothetical protein